MSQTSESKENLRRPIAKPMNPAITVTGSVKNNAAQKSTPSIPSFYNIPMKYSLRSLMIVVTLACIVLGRMAYVRNMAANHEAAVQRLVEDLARERLVYFQHEDGPPSVDRIRRDINAIARANGPLYVVNNHDELFLKREYGLMCYTPDAIELSLTAVQHERTAMAYREAIWKPWRFWIQPAPVQVVRNTVP